MSDQELKKVFQEYIKKAAGGKQLSGADLEWANDKTIARMVKDCIPHCKTHSEASIFPKLAEKRKMSCDVFLKKYFPEIARLVVQARTGEKKLELNDDRVEEEALKLKQAVCAKFAESQSGATGTKSAAVVDRLTDTSKYTGSHKERFDDTGKGKGAAGRKDEVNTSGYTGQYKNEGTYDSKK